MNVYQNQNEADPHGGDRAVNEASHPNEPLQNPDSNAN